jgi:hypothetical protein
MSYDGWCKQCDNPIRFDQDLLVWKAPPEYGGRRCPVTGGSHQPSESSTIREDYPESWCKQCDNPIRYDKRRQVWKAPPEYGGQRCPVTGGSHQPSGS